MNEPVYRTRTIAADNTHPAQELARRTLRWWSAHKRMCRLGQSPGHVLAYSVGMRNSVRSQDLLQRKYDRGED